MSLTIFKHEFRIRVKSVITWSVAIAALVFFFSSLYSSFADQAALTQQLMSKFPPALLEAFGMTRIDLSTVVGYFSFLFVFVQLCLAIQAANYGVGLVSVDESELTADFLLTKPVGRAKILTSKLLGAFTSLLVTEGIIWAVTFIAIGLFSSTT